MEQQINPKAFTSRTLRGLLKLKREELQMPSVPASLQNAARRDIELIEKELAWRAISKAPVASGPSITIDVH